VSLGTYVELNGSGFAEDLSLFYDAGDVPAPKIGAVWTESGGTWTRLDTAELGTAAGKSFARVDRNVTAPSNRTYGVFASDILPVEANFTTSPTDPVEGQFIEFDASVANSPNDAITEYRWDFGDGTTETTTSPRTEHYYDSQGSYTVTLEIEDGVGEVNSTSKTVSVDRAERLFDGGDGATRTFQIANWTHLDSVREVPRGNFEVINDIDNTTADYGSVVNGTDTEFTDEFDSILFPPEQKDLARAPVVASSVSAIDTSDGSSVGINVVDAQNGTVELTEETDGSVRVSYTTQSPTAAGFDPIGDDLAVFNGTLDGNGFTIADLSVEEKQTDVGLFGVLGSNATVRDLTLSDVNVTVFGDFNQDGTGALVGYSDGGTVENVSASGAIDAQSKVGGIVGINRDGAIRDSSAAVTVTAPFSGLGGLVGRLAGTGTVERSSASGAVFGDENQNGGLVGYMRDSTTVRESYAAGDVGPVEGGFINRAGGLVGVQRGGSIVDTYAVGNVTGGSDIGGLVGRTDSLVRTSYAAGNVTASSGGGGLIGDSGFSVDTEAIDSYWDLNTTGQATSNSRNGGDDPLTTSEMKGTQAAVNMTGLDFTNTWSTVERDINANTQEIAYPVLRNNTQIPEPGLEQVVATDNVSVTIDEFTSVARPGNDVLVNATVENVGRSAGTQTVTLSVNGTVESSTGVSLNASETEMLSFNYTATEGDRPEILVEVASENDSATRTVIVGNAAPSASNDSYAVQPDTTLSVADPGVLGNDTDLNGDTLSVVGVVSGPTNGSVSVSASGSFTYTPDLGFLGQDSFTYEVTDGNATDTATVTLDVRFRDLRSIAYGQTKPGLIDDGDPFRSGVNYEPVTFGGAAGDNVTITMTSDGDTRLFLLAPDGTQLASNDDAIDLSDGNSRIENFVLPETGTYTIGATLSGGGPEIPEGGVPERTRTDTTDASTSDGVLRAEETPSGPGIPLPYDLRLEANDTSPGNFSVAVDSTNSPVTVGRTLSVTATIENVGSTDGAQEVQLEAFGGRVADSRQVALGAGNTTTLGLGWPTRAGDAGTGTVTVTSLNDSATRTVTVSDTKPVPGDDSYTVQRDTTLSVADPGVLGNDTDPNGDTLSVSGVVSGPTNGSVSVSASGSFTYTPDLGFLGQDSFTYEVTDGNATDTATVTLDVRFRDLRSIAYGQTKPGLIDDGDPFRSGVNYEPVTFGGAAGDNVTITMTSDGDTKLYLLAPNGTQIAVNDDSSELSDFNSRIENVVLPETGTYTIVATSFSSGARFVYDLGLEVSNTSTGNFSVTVDSTNQPVTEGQPLSVTAGVENIGSRDGAQVVQLQDFGGSVTDSRQVALGAGNTTTLALEWPTQLGDAGSGSVTVASRNDSASEPVTVEAAGQANFSVTIDSAPASVTAGDTVTVDYTVQNTGTAQGTQDVAFDVNGTQQDVTTVTLNASETLSEQFTYSTSSGDTPAVAVTVASANDTASATVDVTGASGLDGLDIAGQGTDAVVAGGADEPIRANVTNLGAGLTDIGVQLEITENGQPVRNESTTVAVDAGATEQVRFDGVTGGLNLSSRNESYGVTVSTGGASLAGTLAVNPDLTGNGLPARDTTGDGLLDNANGQVENGSQVTSIADVQALFESLGTPAVEEIAGRFDFAGLGDGRVSIFDVQALFYQRNSG
jgi:hypothetical protein